MTRLDETAIDELLANIDASSLGACPACLYEAAITIHRGAPKRTVAGAITTACNWTYREMEGNLRVALRRLRARGSDAAEDALVDLEARGWRSRLVRRIVERLCAEMAAEIGESRAAKGVGMRRLSLVPDDP